MPRSYAELKGRLAWTTRQMKSKSGENRFEKEEVIRVTGYDRWVKFQIESIDGKRHLWKVSRDDFILCDPIETVDSRVLAFVDSHPRVSSKEIAEALGEKLPTVVTALKRLWTQTLLNREGPHGKIRYVLPLPKTKGTTWHDRLLASVDVSDQLTIK